MLLPHRFLPLILLAPLAVLLAVAPARGASYIHDNAGYFSPQAIQQAEATIDQIKQAHGKEMVVETFPAIPEELQSQYSAGNSVRFFQSWGNERARALKVDGVYVLICRDPAHLQAEVGQNTQRRAFTLSNRDQLASLMLGKMRGKQYDQALLDGVNYVKQTMDANEAAGAAAAPQGAGRSATPPVAMPGSSGHSGIGGWLCVGAIILGIIVLVSSVMGRRRMYGGGYGPGPGYGGGPGYGPGPGYGGGYGPGYGGGGGGFFRGMLGGLLGGAAGGYLFDRYRDSQAGAAPPPAGGGGSFGAPPDTGTDVGGDYSGTGGDLGGGGDAGGAGDAGGGGDFGGGGGTDVGGDFSGGGGDFGGGGDAGGGGGGDGGGGSF